MPINLVSEIYTDKRSIRNKPDKTWKLFENGLTITEVLQIFVPEKLFKFTSEKTIMLLLSPKKQ